jgi:orotate phosphoribosyltransferase-like protein
VAHPKKVTEEMVKKALEMKAQNLQIKEICYQLDITSPTLYRMLRAVAVQSQDQKEEVGK